MAVLNFVIIAWVVLMRVKAVHKPKDVLAKQEVASETPKGPKQELLLTETRDELKARPN